MWIVFWLLWALGALAVVFGRLLAQTPARIHIFDISIGFCALVFLTAAFLLHFRKKRAIADLWLLASIGAELLLRGHGLLSFV